MPQGLRIWDASGNLTLDNQTSIIHVLGSLTLGDGHAAGSFSDPKLADGRPFAYCSTNSVFGVTSFRKFTDLSASGTTISYGAGDACTIVYGFY